jgi:hypothetical protein
MSVTVNGTSGVTFNDNSSQTTAATGFGFKNRIINGAMVIDQRNAGASVTLATSNYTLDRWQLGINVASKVSVQQNAGSVTPPAGFTNYLGVTSVSAYSIGAAERIGLFHNIEGRNVADLGWGTASASAVTLSFWVRSSLTGTFGGVAANSAYNRTYVFSYTINAANTWEYKTVTISGDTSGTWLTDNSLGLAVSFAVSVGSSLQGTAGSWGTTANFAPTGQVNVAGTNGATFYITGVQLEKGSTATSFDYRPYGTELALCQRYLPYFSANGSSSATLGVGQTAATTAALALINFPVQTRVPPSGITISSSSHFSGTTTGGSQTAFTSVTLNATNVLSSEVYGTGATGMGAAGGASQFRMNNASAYIYFTGCEL